jgi:hypothetical protein
VSASVGALILAAGAKGQASVIEITAELIEIFIYQMKKKKYGVVDHVIASKEN